MMSCVKMNVSKILKPVSKSQYTTHVWLLLYHNITFDSICVRNIAVKFSVLNPSNLIAMTDDRIFEEASKLMNEYRDELNVGFPQQLLCFRSAMKTQIKNKLLPKIWHQSLWLKTIQFRQASQMSALFSYYS